jgi:hypothetical protein
MDNSTYTDSTIVPGQSYYYRVVAINLVGDTWDYGAPTVQNFPTVTVASQPTNTVGPTLTKVTLISAAAGSSGITVTLEWTVEGTGTQTGFIIQRATNLAFTQGVRNLTAGAAAVTYTDTTLINPGTTYYYRVLAASGSYYGPWSNVMVVTTPV